MNYGQRVVRFQALHFIDISSSISRNFPGPLCDMRQNPVNKDNSIGRHTP